MDKPPSDRPAGRPPAGGGAGTEKGSADTGLPKRIGPYKVVRLLGSGGMGQVFEAVHEQIGRRAAVKVLHRRFVNNKQIAIRFVNEARAVNIVQHPSLVNIYEFGQAHDGSAYIVMEYLDGETLRQRLEKSGGRLPQDEVMRLGRQIASALAAAHQKDIIHRDLKPVNIMIIADPEAPGGERAKVLDFGLAKVLQPDAEGEGLTGTGTILGTPAYMAPEQCRSARAVDDKSDVYALGVILYEMISSDIPFDAETDAELLSMHMYKPAPPLTERAPGVLPELSALIHRMLEKEQPARPRASEVAAELTRLYVAASATPDTAMAMMQTGRVAMAPGTRPGAAAGVVAAAAQPVPSGRLAAGSDAATLVRGDAEKTDQDVPAGKSRGERGSIGQKDTVGLSLGHERTIAQEARAASAPAPAPSPGAPAPRRRSRGRVVVAFVLGTAIAAGVSLGVRQWRAQHQAPPKVQLVRWSLASTPAEAEVVRDDGQVLGRTPLFLEQPSAPGTQTLVLRYPGYAEQPVTLPRDRDVARTEILAPLPPPTSAPAPGSTADLGPPGDADTFKIEPVGIDRPATGGPAPAPAAPEGAAPAPAPAAPR